MIEIKNVSKKFDDKYVLKNININMNKGKIIGIIGENGAGKTTLLQMMAGIYKVEEGDILFCGETIYENNNVKKNIGYVADRNQYFRDYKISEIVKFYEGIYEKFSKDDFLKYNEIFNLDISKKIRQLSKGMQMRLSIMLNLAINPKVLILDEPTSGLDAMAKKDFLDILISKVEDENILIVISSHHILELEKICDEIVIIHDGQIKYNANVDDIKEKITKLQVVFSNDVEEDIKKLKYVLEYEKIGSIYYLIIDNYSKDIEDEFLKMGAILVEKIGMTLEEAFIYINKREGVSNE